MNMFSTSTAQWRLYLSLWWVLGIGTACQRYPYVGVKDLNVTNLRYRFSFTASQKSDILLVLDNSGSMSEEQANLKRNVSAFIQRIVENNRDFHLAMVSVDPDLPNRPAGEFLPIANLDGTLSQQRFLRSPEPENNANGVAERNALIQQVEKTLERFQTIQGATNESGLHAMWAGINPNSFAANTNQGFLRPEADLNIIFITDEDDCSQAEPSLANNTILQNNNTACYQQSNQALLADAKSYVNKLLSVKSNIQQIRSAFISGFQNSEQAGIVAQGCIEQSGQPSFQCGCWSAGTGNNIPEQQFFCQLNTPPLQQACDATPMSCSGAQVLCEQTCVERCSSLPARRYGEFAQALQQARLQSNASGGVATFPICAQDFKEPLLAIADNIVAPSCLQLDQPLLDNQNIVVYERWLDDKQQPQFRLLPQVNNEQDCASCPTCTSGAFFVRDLQEICLTCGAIIKAGSQFEIEAPAKLP